MKKLPKVLDVKNPRDPSRDPKVQEIHAVQELPREVHIVRAKFFLVITSTCIVKGPLLEPMNPTL